MDFNFGNLSNNNFVSNSTQYLKPYGIYNVSLTSIKNDTIKGSKDPNASYEVISLEFTGKGEDKGIFTTNLFVPSRQEDIQRPTYKNAEGHEYNGPSSFERFQYTLMQIVEAINPEGAKKIKENSSKIKTMKTFTDLIIKALTNKENVEVKLKLVGRTSTNGVVYSQLPNAVGLNREGELYPINFIGENLFFTNYELSQQKKYNNAKPTQMKDLEENPDTTEEDIDISGLDLDV